jgi:hypothetical protein
MSTSMPRTSRLFQVFFTILALAIAGLFVVSPAQAQMDQGTITGVVTDQTGALIPNAKITLTATDTGLSFERSTNESGIYVFSPVKIGRYSITVAADGFQTSRRENLVLNVQARLGVNFDLKPGSVTDSVTVNTAPPLLDTQTGAVGQVVDSNTINETPLNGRNWVFIAQLSAGIAPPQGQTRGSGKGDFVANGQRAEQNNFILDGVDNNTNLVDFLNGSTFVMRPPPDALAEFNLQTSNYSAEFGHSAGAVLNASIKSGTNAIHGSLWEYYRSDKMNARNWNALTVPAFHQNQFGATLGFPILKDKLFYFGDIEANRVSFGSPQVFTVPTTRMRTGDFTELLNPSLTGYSGPINLYQPGSRGTIPLGQPCGRSQNVFCASDINPTAQNILNLYPQPNVNNGRTYNNYNTNIGKRDNTIQWDQRLDWNISSKDQIFGRYSYFHEIINNGLPFGPILDGSGYGGERDTNLAQNGMFSETHVFSPSLTNEFRFGYNWGVFRFLQPNANNSTLASTLGLGNVPFSPYQGGLPQGQLQGTVGASYWGSVGTSNESQNVYQILDNMTKIVGNHSMKFGVAFQNVRFYYTYAAAPRGQYNFNGSYTSVPGSSATSGIADFLANQMSSAYVSNAPPVHDQQWYDSAYFQDDWRASSKLTLNLGLRWDWYQPYAESRDRQANFVLTGPVGLNSNRVGTGTAVYQLPQGAQRYALGPAFVSLLAANHVAIQYVDNARLLEAQKVNFAPRFGFAYQLDSKSVIRGGYGLFYGGLQSHGNGNLGANYPFTLDANYNQPTCNATTCNPLPYTLQSGLPALNADAVPTQPGFHSTDPRIKTPYTQNYSLTFQRALSPDFVASIAYVGNVSHHLSTYWAPNSSLALTTAGTNTNNLNPFPTLGWTGQIQYSGVSNYNSLQTKLEKRFSRGLSFLATYTWAHALDNSSSAGGLSNGIGVRSYYLLGLDSEYTNSSYDIRHRVTFNGSYQLPFGHGRNYLNDSRLLDLAVGGWQVSGTFTGQTGIPLGGISPIGSTASGGSARAVKVGDPFRAGGTAPAGGASTCPSQVRTKDNWYNPCAFANPLSGNTIPAGTLITNPTQVLAYLGDKQNLIYGPGFWRADTSLFKNFVTFREQYLQFRADAFNVFNHPTLSNPSNTSNGSNGGQITGPKNLQANAPDARFLQLSLKYVF